MIPFFLASSFDRILTLCAPGTLCPPTPTSPSDGFGALCRIAAGLLARALAGDTSEDMAGTLGGEASLLEFLLWFSLVLESWF